MKPDPLEDGAPAECDYFLAHMGYSDPEAAPKMTKARKMTAFGSGNVFEDLGVPDPDEHLAKSGLVREIASVMEARGLAEVDVARILGVPLAGLSRLINGHFRNLGLDHLRHGLERLRALEPSDGRAGPTVAIGRPTS